MLAEFVRLVTEMVPELLVYRHRTQLILGLQARHILDLCRSARPVDPQVILTHLHNILPFTLNSDDIGDLGVESSGNNFLELVQTLLKDVDQREQFFTDIFPVEFGPQFDLELQTLMWEFLSRLVQLLPTPDLAQTIEWLGSATPVLDDFANMVSHPTDLKCLLQHHKRLGHLEQHVPSCAIGDYILTSLSISPHRKKVLDTEKTTSDQSEPAHEFPENADLVDDHEVKIEYVLSPKVEELSDGNSDVGQTSVGKDTKPVETDTEEVTGTVGAMQEHEDGVMESESIIVEAKVKTSQQPINSVALNCSVCKKSFRFASALIAHQVVHTGERPYVCSLCGRCFSFKQSLDRHRRTHNCSTCGETFQSLSACMEHKKSHMGPVVHQCCESAIVRHLKIHMQPSEVGPAELTKIIKLEQEDAENLETVGELSDETEAALQDEGKSNHSLLEGQGQSGSSSSPEPSVLGTGVMQKRKGKATTPKTIRTLISLERSEPLAVKSEEDFYGFPTASREDRGVSTRDQVHVQQHIEAGSLKEVQGDSKSARHRLGKTGLYNCPDCDKSFKYPSILKYHQGIHAGECPFVCSQCSRRFSFKQSLERHTQTHKNGRKYECPICGQNFKSLSAKTEHTKSHMENGLYRCSDCDRTFSWKSALVRHLRIHTENAAGTERPHKCPRCDLAFSSIRYLNRHLVTHQEERLHVCTCGKAFAYKTALTAHQLTHLKERPHQCKQCGKGFLYKGELVSHMKIHSDEMPFMCSFCGKGFKMERNMKKHESSHNRENMYRCTQCVKTFVYKATLTRHELTHSGERPFLCADCGKGFFSRAELLKHERYHAGHKPFQCSHCGKKFTQSCYLTIHLRYHTGLRPYSCIDCGKRFISANRLKRHTRTHTGEKPYLMEGVGEGS